MKFKVIWFIIIVSSAMVIASGAAVRVVTAKDQTYIVSDTKVPFASIASGCASFSGRPTNLTSNQEYIELVDALAKRDPPFRSSLWFSLTKNSNARAWAWEAEISDSVLWFNNTTPLVQEPNNEGNNCNSENKCICGSLAYAENSIKLVTDTHKLFDTCCTDSHYFFCKDLNECACSNSEAGCTSAAADCQAPTSQCLDLIGSYRCINLLPAPALAFDTVPITFSIGSQVTLNCTIPHEDIPYKADVPTDTRWTLGWVRNGKSVATTASNDSLFSIDNLSSDTEGSYQCLYSIGEVHSAKSNTLDITVRPLTTPSLTAPRTDAAMGEIVNLTCSTTSPGNKFYEWTLPSGTSHQTSQETYSFQITGSDMLGIYTCRANIPTLDSTSLSSAPFVLDLKLSTPELRNMNDTNSFALDEILTLQCTTIDSVFLQRLTYTFQKDGQNIKSISYTSQYTITVNHASVKGVYTCSTAHGTKESEISNKITLQYKWSSVPVLQVNSTLLFPGATVQFICLSDELGNITLEILKVKQALLLVTAQCASRENVLHQKCMNLQVQGIDDTGTYFCKAEVENSVSSRSNLITLASATLAKPILTANYQLGKFDLISLRCDINADWTPCQNCDDLVYIFQFEMEKGSTRKILETDEPVLNLTLATSQDEGDYWCSVKQDWLISNMSNMLHLTRTKYEVTIKSSVALIPKGNEVEITCSPSWTESQPQELRWFKDSMHIKTGLETSIVLRDFCDKDEGVYTCQVFSRITDQWVSSNSTMLTLLLPYQICTCACTNMTVEIEITDELMETFKSKIGKDLLITGNLSMTKRKKTCVYDDRASSTACGGISILMLVAITAFIIYLDSRSLSKMRKPWRGMQSKNRINNYQGTAQKS